jgi:gliding motility-associated-like protein
VPSATDNCEGTVVTLTEGLAPGSEFPVGTTTVTYTATDAAGNTVSTSFTVTVIDNEAPVISCNENISVDVEFGVTGAVVTFDTPTATDNCSGISIAQREGLSSGSEFPIGTTTNKFIVTDAAGNTATCSITVTVVELPEPTPATPTVVEVIQPTCEVSTGSFSITAVEGLEYSLNGGAYTATTSFDGLSAGTYTVTARNAEGDVSEAVSITINDQLVAPATPVVATTIQPTCSGTSGSFSITAGEGLEYSLNGGAYATTTSFEGLSAGNYSVTARNAGGCVSNAVNVTIEEPQSNATVNTTPFTLCDNEGTFNLDSLISGDDAVTGTWIDTDQTGALTGRTLDPAIPAPGIYTFTYVIEGACASTTAVTIEIEDCGEVADCTVGDIKASISKAVTPGGDNFNDTFVIDKENTCGFQYNVKIFNRWGAEVFAANRYQNNWDGFSNRSVSSSNQLPSGTYYYIVEILENNGSRSAIAPIQGYIFLGTK